MAIGLIDYPLRDNLAAIRDQLDGSKRETLLPEHAMLLSRTTSVSDAIFYVQAALATCLGQFLKRSDISVSHPLMRALLILQGADDAADLAVVLTPIRDEELKSRLMELAGREQREWNVDNFEWQLVQALQLGWPDVPVLPDTPVHRLDAEDGSLLLQLLLQIETLRTWGLLS